MSKFNLRGKLTLTIHSARNLANRELLGKMDPFAVLHLSGSKDEKFKTKVVKDGHQNPVWEQSYIFNLEGREELLHANVWNEATLGDDHIGRLDLSLDALDMSGTKRWYQLKDKANFTKQTGEVCMTVIFEGSGLPEGSTAYTTNAARLKPQGAAVSSPQQMAPQGMTPTFSSPPIATIAPPVVQQAYGSQQPQPQYNQPPPQQVYGSQQPVYGSQAPPQQVYSQPPPVQYAPPPQPMYQAPPQVQYGAPPMQPIYQSQAPVYQQPMQPQYAPPQPQYAPQQPQYQHQPQPQFQSAPIYQQQPQTQVVYTQHAPQRQGGGQIIGYWPNGQPRYAGQ